MMASAHKHHIVPRSKGGPDEEWNFVNLDPYTHAYEHALDFVLFEHAPQFHFQQPGWKMLPEDLQEAVRKETSIRKKKLPKSSRSNSNGNSNCRVTLLSS
jgi:hypothetical protein